MNNKTLTLIIGCGYLGNYLLDHLHNKNIIVTSRSSHKVAAFKARGLEAFVFDLNNDNQALFERLMGEERIELFFLLPPTQIQTDRLTFFLDKLNDVAIYKSVMTSSTVVYGNDSRTVDADSAVILDSERARKQHAIERLWLEANDNVYVVRLAGLYGKDRVIGCRNLQQGKPIRSKANAWLNLIHAYDAASLIKSIMHADAAKSIELGCDNHPVKRQVYYSWLAERLNTSPPRFENSETSRGGNRQCSSSITQKRVAWRPQYESYIEGISPLLTDDNI